MKKWLLLIGYCVPYAFLAMYADAALGTMAGYAGMIAGLALMTWVVIRMRGMAVCIVGNIISFLASLAVSGFVEMERWRWYFKPFGPEMLLCALSVVMFVVQLVFVRRKKRRHE